MNEIWVLILVIAAPTYGGYSPSVTTHEFTSEQSCLQAVRTIQLQQKELNSRVRVASYSCSKK